MITEKNEAKENKLVEFAEKYLGVPLMPWQKKILETSDVKLNAGRKG